VQCLNSDVFDTVQPVNTEMGFRTVGRRLLPAAVCVCAVAVANVWNPGDNGPPLCPIRAVTGYWCPGCGMTRAALALGRGDWSVANRYHPWVWFLAAQLVVLAVAQLASIRSIQSPRTSGLADRVRNMFFSASGQRVFLLNGVGLIVLWIVRMATGAIPVVGLVSGLVVGG
jgi:Protein of unknown function (DUF2752)